MAIQTQRCVPTRNRMTLVGAVYLFLLKAGDEVLLMRRAGTGYADGSYSVPAGHIDPGESATAAIIRETIEEIGVEVELRDLRLVHVMHRRSVGTDCTNSERVDFFFVAERWTGEPVNCEPLKCDDVSWHPVTDLPKQMVSYVQDAWFWYQNCEPYSEQGWGPPCPQCGAGEPVGAVMTR
jgi:8-oxo-dGTP diphosphatase